MLSHQVIFNLLQLRWYGTFITLRQGKWIHVDYWKWIFSNMWSVIDIILFPLIFTILYIIRVISGAWRKRKGNGLMLFDRVDFKWTDLTKWHKTPTFHAIYSYIYSHNRITDYGCKLTAISLSWYTLCIVTPFLWYKCLYLPESTYIRRNPFRNMLDMVSPAKSNWCSFVSLGEFASQIHRLGFDYVYAWLGLLSSALMMFR